MPQLDQFEMMRITSATVETTKSSGGSVTRGTPSDWPQEFAGTPPRTTRPYPVPHPYLPGNPVDLEQREGRVHRYKGYAVRKNIAACYGHLPLNGYSDIWRSMFDQAHADRAESDNDLVPYWLFPTEGGAVIERHVPHLPLSRDGERLIALRRSLAIYRMVFGQSRQEDMVKYLLGTVPEANMEEIMQEIVIDLGVGKHG